MSTNTGNPVSHFEMYRNAMKQIDADTQGIDQLLSALPQGNNIFEAIHHAELPDYVANFLRFTFDIIEEGKPIRLLRFLPLAERI